MSSARVIDKRIVAGPYFELRVEAPEIAACAKAGQFVQVRCCASFDPLLPRPMSIEWADADEGWIRLLIRIMGKGSTLLSQKRPGDAIDLTGPLGNTFGFDPTTEGKHILVGGGAGIAPLLFLAKEIAEAGCADRVVAMIGASSGGHLLRIDEMCDTGAHVLLATDDATVGFAGTVADLFRESLAKNELGTVAKVYTCGPNPMMRSVADACEQRRIACELSLETYMACGTGICLGCMVKTRSGDMVRTCKEGPIFDSKMIAWE